MTERAEIDNKVTNVSEYSKFTAYLFCLFGGWLGLHYFYVGRVGRGMLALFTLNIITIGWIVDTFKIQRGRFKDCNGHYLIN